MTNKCQCTADSRDNPNPAYMYEREERKARRHAPGECPGDYGMARYCRADGSIAWLCSCCNLSSDKRLDEEVQAGASA